MSKEQKSFVSFFLGFFFIILILMNLNSNSQAISLSQLRWMDLVSQFPFLHVSTQYCFLWVNVSTSNLKVKFESFLIVEWKCRILSENEKNRFFAAQWEKNITHRAEFRESSHRKIQRKWNYLNYFLVHSHWKNSFHVRIFN